MNPALLRIDDLDEVVLGMETEPGGGRVVSVDGKVPYLGF